jgi:hypothetical protein
VAGESNTIRIGNRVNHTNTYLAGTINIEPTKALKFGDQTRQMINLWNETFGIGAQTNTFYSRSSSEFAWYKGGVHSDGHGDAGTGGSKLMILSSSGLPVNGTFVSASDRNAKENFEEVDPRAVLEKVAFMPIQTWNYRTDDNKTRHIGPMAQDFYAVFGVGPDDKHMQP